MSKTLLESLRAKRDEGLNYVDGVLDAIEARAASMGETATADDLKPTDEERTNIDFVNSEVDALEERIAEFDGQAERRAKVSTAARAISVKAEPMTYNRHNARSVSYFRDLAVVQTGQLSHLRDGALERLNRHAAELEVELPAREARREANAEQQIRSVDKRSAFEKRVNPNRTDGQGGFFVPPLWLIDEYIPFLRAGRVTANQLRSMDLPEGTDSINIPKLASGTATGVQTADAGAVTSTDFTDTSVSAKVNTLAGQQDVSILLLEQSPGQIIDQVVLTDLLADYNQKLDQQALNGTGSSGQGLGISQVPSLNAITYTDASPTQPELWAPLAQALSQIATKRFDFSNVVTVMHPRRWFWIAAGLDTQNRPLVVPKTNGAFNSFSEVNGEVAEGYVGDLVLGSPVFIDANVITNDGGGTNQDQIYTFKRDDTFLFEGAPRTRVLTEILSGTLQVRFQLYNYFALLTRYKESISAIAGTGLVAPSGF